MRVSLFTAIRCVAALVMLAGCNRLQSSTQLQSLVESSTEFSAPVFAKLPAEERRQWERLSRPGRQLGYFEIVNGCGGDRGQIRPILPDVGPLHSQQDRQQVNQAVYDAMAGQGFFEHPRLSFSGGSTSRVFHCQLNTQRLRDWVSRHSDLVSEQDGRQAVLLGTRSNLQFDELRSYEAEVPLQGRRPFLSSSFTYRIESNFDGVVWEADGTGFIKAFQNVDTGEWDVVELTFQDPPLLYQQASSTSETPTSIDDSGTLAPASQQATSATHPGYTVQRVEAQPFLYVETCRWESDWVEAERDMLSMATAALPTIMRQRGLTLAGSLTTVSVPPRESRPPCLQVGYPYEGTEPTGLLLGKVGRTPGGVMLRLHFNGSSADAVSQVYDPMNAFLAASQLNDPTTTSDDWTTFETYRNPPTGSALVGERDIYFVTQGDISRLPRQ